ncbi:uncharacterized protein TNCV_4886581 [Trichonephila clavipes]|uniref:Uncharacterized protein n=1 Tax=Trichonephila clavipes TaxID=2585209 RepID=A0A8X6V5I0_TRICX|nr:uncharacterized protein TNCV_4886581 [Trichonephila clavipes]
MHMNLNIISSKTFNFYKAKVLNGYLVGSNQLLLDVRKNIREAYGSKIDKDIVDIGVSNDGSWLTREHCQTSEWQVACNLRSSCPKIGTYLLIRINKIRAEMMKMT